MRAAAAGLGAVVLEDFAHDLAGLRGFGVGDVDGEVVAAGDLVQLTGQGVGREVLAEPGQGFVGVAKCGFNHQGTHGQLVDTGLQGRVGPGVNNQRTPT